MQNALRQSLDKIAQPEQKVNELEARLNRHSGSSSQHPFQDSPHAPKTTGEKAYAIPVANLDIRETMGNWRRLRKWIRSWSLGRKPLLTVGVCWLRVREDNCEWKSHMGPVMAIQNGPTLVHGNADRTNQPQTRVSERGAGGSPN